MTNALAAINARIVELEAKLAGSPIYRELTILCKARDDLRNLSTSSTDSVKDVKHAPHVGPKRVTMIEGVRLALAEKGHPMTSAELVESLPQYGVTVGGQNPRQNLTSVLSKRGREIESIRWQDKHTWWFRNQPLPNDEAEGNPSQDQPSAPNSSQGGNYEAATLV